VKNKYATLEKFYTDWQTPPNKGKEVHFICYLVFSKIKHNNIINISRKKALATHDLNVDAKVFFYDKPKFVHLKNKGDSEETCPKSAEKLNDAGFKFKKIEIDFNPQKFAILRDRASGVYIYGARLKTA